jgi:catechol 2,3-dioxygenase-like lactoylglutathione lyase family enzyme
VSTVSVRYIVDDVDAAIDFYTGRLGFREQMHPDPAFAMLTRGDLRLVLVAPVPPGHPGGGSRPLPDGTRQRPGGWNRFMLEVPDLAAAVEELRASGVRFRTEIVTGIGVKQVMIEDPSGNPVELFEPVRAEARLDTRLAQPGPLAAVLPQQLGQFRRGHRARRRRRALVVEEAALIGHRG